MQLRWTEEAEADIRRIADFLFEHTPEHAPRIVQAIYDAPASLLTFPGRGRPGKKQGTRELVLASLPYLVVYVVTGDIVHIARLLHGAQKWPWGFSAFVATAGRRGFSYEIRELLSRA